MLTYGLTEMSYIVNHLLFNQYIDIIKPSGLFPQRQNHGLEQFLDDKPLKSVLYKVARCYDNSNTSARLELLHACFIIARRC